VRDERKRKRKIPDRPDPTLSHHFQPDLYSSQKPPHPTRPLVLPRLELLFLHNCALIVFLWLVSESPLSRPDLLHPYLLPAPLTPTPLRHKSSWTKMASDLGLYQMRTTPLTMPFELSGIRSRLQRLTSPYIPWRTAPR
jgi:hypothetical protein